MQSFNKLPLGAWSGVVRLRHIKEFEDADDEVTPVSSLPSKDYELDQHP